MKTAPAPLTKKPLQQLQVMRMRQQVWHLTVVLQLQIHWTEIHIQWVAILHSIPHNVKCRYNITEYK